MNDESRICTVCWSSLTRINPGDEVWEEIHGKFAAEEAVSDFLSCYLFEKEGILQHVIHLLKYQGMRSLGVRLGHEIGMRIQNNSAFSFADTLIPVPLHKLKLRERGYNQSEYICKGISEVTSIPVHSKLIRRSKYTQSQTQLNLIERKENVGDAFVIKKRHDSLIEGKKFILVDDVITTGATINACARELRANGAADVLAASTALAK